ncbi:MAG: glycosyltransferase family 4 protein [Anaerolineae bacterium]|nr:glycosyltransferase family 4 protein [Anaerolineae bacterium]
MHIGLNAHLLSGQASYRSAGIHGYIANSLAHMAAAAPADWRFTAMVGAANRTQFPGMTMHRSRFDTDQPLRRILWEQAVQPWQLGEFDLYHALAFVAPLWLNTPLVVTVYDLSFIHYPQVLSASRRLYLRLLTRLSCHRARRVSAISHSTARDVADSLGISMSKIDVAAPGYDPEQYRLLSPEAVAAFRQQKQLPDRFWLFVGTLEPRKNLTTLLEAYARLPRTERLPLFLGGGKGWLYADIFAAIERHQLADQVHWLDYLPAEELPLWYNSAEVFVFPSVFEGFGLPVLEAMACGTPVIVSDASSLPEVAGSAGLTLSPYDEEAWTGALHRAFGDAHWRAQASQQGLKEAQRYSWQETVRQIFRSYACA